VDNSDIKRDFSNMTALDTSSPPVGQQYLYIIHIYIKHDKYQILSD